MAGCNINQLSHFRKSDGRRSYSPARGFAVAYQSLNTTTGKFHPNLKVRLNRIEGLLSREATLSVHTNDYDLNRCKTRSRTEESAIGIEDSVERYGTSRRGTWKATVDELPFNLFNFGGKSNGIIMNNLYVAIDSDTGTFACCYMHKIAQRAYTKHLTSFAKK